MLEENLSDQNVERRSKACTTSRFGVSFLYDRRCITLRSVPIASLIQAKARATGPSQFNSMLRSDPRKSLLRSPCGSFLARKDPHLPAFGQKRQYPLQHDEESVLEPDQEIDVHDRPVRIPPPCRSGFTRGRRSCFIPAKA